MIIIIINIDLIYLIYNLLYAFIHLMNLHTTCVYIS